MNPFKILALERNATQREIIQAGARAMQDRHYSGKEIAEAQRALMNPISRATHEFLHFIEISPLQDSSKERLQEKAYQFRQEDPAAFRLEYRPIGEKKP